MSVEPLDNVRRLPTRDDHRHRVAERLLKSLDDLVTRHRTLALQGEYVNLHAELIAAEVAQELAVTRAALRRYPPPR